MGLQGKRVLVTRPRSQSAEMVAAIEQRGGIAIVEPLIETVDPQSWDEADRAIGRLAEFDALAFASVNAVERFVARCPDRRVLARLPAFAVGTRTAEAAKRHGLTIVKIPEEFSAGGLLRALESGSIRGKRVLLPRGESARNELLNGLRALGAVVEPVTVYRTVRPAAFDAHALKGELRDRRFDAVTLMSPSAVSHFAALFTPAELAALAGTVVIAAIGQTTAAAAREAGCAVDVVATESTSVGLIRALDQFFG
jgi:uroporphyrinogen III methyltransferase / synthase